MPKMMNIIHSFNNYKLSKRNVNLQKYVLNVFLLLTLLITISGCGSGNGGAAGDSLSDSNPDSSPADDPPSPIDLPPAPTGSVTISWETPIENTDESLYTDHGGYIVHYGNSSNDYTNSVNVGNVTAASISSLSLGTWCFAITAYNLSGNESDYSNEGCIIIQ